MLLHIKENSKENQNLSQRLNKKVVAEYLTAYGLMAAVIGIIFNFILILSPIPSGSMETTIMTGDIVIGTRWDADEINRYDVMIFDAPDQHGTDYIKRVIGLPGETVVVSNGVVTVDGNVVDSSFLPEKMDTGGDGTYVVPENCYFMMGDNRNNSYDARFWNNKYVPTESFVAKAKVRLSLKGIFSLVYHTEGDS